MSNEGGPNFEDQKEATPDIEAAGTMLPANIEATGETFDENEAEIFPGMANMEEVAVFAKKEVSRICEEGIREIETIESGETKTLAEEEVVGLTQDAVNYISPEEQRMISTPEEVNEYLTTPSWTERVSVGARKKFAIFMTATAFSAAAAAPAVEAGGWGNVSNTILQQGVQQFNYEMQARQQIESIKQRCDSQIDQMKSQAESQIEMSAMRADIDMNGINLGGREAVAQFQAKYPNATSQQKSAFSSIRSTYMHSQQNIKSYISNCDMQVKNISRGAENYRNQTIINTIPQILQQR